MTGIESLDERWHSAHARRDAAMDELCRAIVKVDDATRDLEDLLDQRLDAASP